MATYQTRQRDPLLDQHTQALLERRGRELLGLGLIVLALMLTALLATYSSDDPGWMVATDAPINNALGRIGAAIASTLFVIGGLGSWGIPIVLGVWGVRFVLHRGEERALGRIVFAVIAVALGSVFAATHVPGPNWPHPSIGLGGLFGDTVLGALLTLLPLPAGLGLKLLSLGFGAALVGMGLYVTGFTLVELHRAFRFVLRGIVLIYASALTIGGRSAARAATAVQDRRLARKDAVAEAAVNTNARMTQMSPAPLGSRKADDAGATLAQRSEPPVMAPRTGLLARMPQLLRRALPDAEPQGPEIAPEDRIKARINDVIRARLRPAQVHARSPVAAAVARREPGLMRRAAPLVVTPRGLPPEPPVVAGAALLPPVAARLPIPDMAEPDVDEDPVYDADDDAFGPDRTAEFETPDDEDDDDDGFDPQIVSISAPPGRTASDLRRIVQPTVKKAPPPSRQAMAEAQPRLGLEAATSDYALPPLNLLSNPDEIQRHSLSEESLEENARMLESVLDDYGVKGEIVSVRPGPVVTMYELEPAPGLKASRVIGLADDIARSMSALSARVSTVPGRSVIGIELPNAWREKVVLREILAARDFGDSTMRLPLALGKDIGGEPIVANLAKMPHLLIAGTTGSGKSVAINTMILSLLYKLSPEECRLIMIDPKMLELSVYDGIPHLLSPVVTDPKKAVVALKWVVGEMEERYRKMSRTGVRNIEGFNGRVREALAKNEMFKRTIQTGFDDDTGEPVFETEEFAPVALPYIVVVVDEMADLMMVAGKEIEACIQRLAQMARASGIHLIMATQRPSVDVITGTIKANFPTRISFQVTSKIDSRTILGEQGAEQLLGMGDMLYMAGGAKITRIHGPFVSDEEVEEIVTHLKSYGPPTYMSGVVEGVDEDKEGDIDLVLGLGSGEGGEDALYDQAVAVVAKDRKVSTSYIQRKLGVGYNKAAKLVEQMEDQGVISGANHVGRREVLLPEH